METMRDAWTDERLDDLNHRVDSGFREIGEEFRALRLEMRTESTALRLEMRTEFAALRAESQTEFGAVRSELGSQIAALHRTMIQAFVVLIVGFLGVIATILTQV
jgi:hypothetical protein